MPQPGDAARVTLDAQNKKSGTGPVMTDSDDHWDLAVRDYLSPDQRVGVDAHTYAGVVDGYYASTFGRNSIDDKGLEIRSVVHYSRHYCNAFWNGVQMTYGDGDNKGCLPLSGGLDVVAHELTHGVTEFTSGLVYQNEPGALNEAFSDIMGNTIELQNAGLTPYTDSWRLAEGVYAGGGFRNMADPQEFGDPDHYSELYTGTADSGGVHSNSGIANHAYYLLVNGGKNAGCGGSASGHTHTLDCDVTVPGIGLAPAQRIFYDGFTALSENSNFCDARNSTVAVSGEFSANVDAAWDAVGVHEGCTTAPPPPAPCATDTAVSSTPFESTHPYRDESDCTWTYTNATPGFQFHFSLLDTERNYDYVYVEDADGNVLKAYTGTYKRGATSPCITGTVGKVHLVSDPFVTGQGFTVDSVTPC